MGLPTQGTVTPGEIEWKLACETSLHVFIQRAWHVVEPAVDFIDGWHLHAICEHLEAVVAGDITNLLIQIPPGTMKSLSSSVFLCPWAWATKPDLRFFYASYDQSLSTRDSLRSRTIIDSKWYRQLWSHKFQLRSDQNEKMRFDNDHRGWRIASSVGGRGTGEHMDVLVCDDPHNTRKVESETDRDTVKLWWKNVIASRGKIRGVRRVVVMQRVHEDDLVQHIKDTDGDNWEELCLPMRYEPSRMTTTSLGFNDPREEPGELLWDPPFDEVKVQSLEREMGSLVAAGQLQQRPSPAGGYIFKREWFDVLDNVPDTKDRPAVRYWDLAGSVRKEADYTAGVKMVDMGDYVLIDDVVHGKWSSHERDQVMLQTAKVDGVDVPIVVEQEPGSSGLTVIAHYVRLLRGFAVYSDKPGTNKQSRAMPFASYSEAKAVKIRRANWNATLLDELEVFPNGKHDDQVDACSGAFTQIVGGNTVPMPDEILATGDDPEEHRPFDQNELEELPDYLRELVQTSRDLAEERDDYWE